MRFPLITALMFCLQLPTAIAEELPDIKAGLWEIRTETSGQPSSVIKQCVDEDTAKNLFRAAQSALGGQCSAMNLTRKGSEYRSAVTCNMMGTKMTANTVVSGDFSKRYSSTTQTKFDPPLMGQSSSTSRATGTWVGECEAGMKPGDTILANGQRLNPFEVMKGLPKPGSVQGGQMPSPEQLKEMMEQVQRMQQQAQ